MGAISAFAYPAYRVAERAACVLPDPLVPAVAGVAGRVAVATMPARRRMVARHQERVRGRLSPRERRRAVRATFTSYAAYWLDTFRLCRIGGGDLAGRLDADGLEHLDEALAAGRGAILATPHFGSWDLGGAWLAHRGYPLVAVVERLPSPRLLDWFRTVRRRVGMEVVVRGPDVWDELEATLAANRVAVLVSDRDLSGRGVGVELFGERTTLPAGPARLARRCGAPLLPVAVYATGGGRHRGVVRPPVPVPRTDDDRADAAVVAQRLAVELEGLIRPAPEHWHLLQPNWPSDREGHGA
jgi:phosphatidylinositol dimannoside acyltransferase